MTSAERNRQAAVIIWSSLIVITVLLLSRRVAGGIESITSAWPCVLVSLLATILSGFGWLSFQQRADVMSPRAEQIAAVVTWMPTWLSGLAVLPSESPLARGWLVGIAALSAGGIAMTSRWFVASDVRGQALRNSELADSSAILPERIARPIPNSEGPDPLSVFDPVTDERSNDSTTQWMTRQSLPSGVDQIEGAIRVSFAAGQRAVSVHVPFSPPFATVPQVECEAIGDDPVRWKISVVYAYGMRVELKRESNDEPGDIELSYSAVSESAAEAA